MTTPHRFWTIFGMVYLAFNFWASFIAMLEDASYHPFFPLLVLAFIGIPYAIGILTCREWRK